MNKNFMRHFKVRNIFPGLLMLIFQTVIDKLQSPVPIELSLMVNFTLLKGSVLRIRLISL